jgi:5-enolpyruvylshikimate-3-phosphate synthase
MPSTKTYSNQRDVFDEVSVPQILSKLGVKITSPTHSNCPMHCSVAEKCLHYSDRVWYCFHCGESGGTVRLVMAAKKCDYKTAEQWVKKEFGLR